MTISQKDRAIMRDLAVRIVEVGSLPAQDDKHELWRKLNRLEPARPLVWINEIPWHELGVELHCEDEELRHSEGRMRQLLYQWEHMPGDMVVRPVWYTPYCFEDTGYGLGAEYDSSEQWRGAVRYKPVIREEADVEKIKTPRITPDWEATERVYERYCELFGDILQVEKRGIAHEWCAPWDRLVCWYGINELYVDMMDRPELVHKTTARFTDALLARLDQLEQLGLLSPSDGNFRVGSGGMGITDELPQEDFDPRHVRPMDQWGTSTGQIFSEVSPAMHDEFCLQYEIRYLERFGLNAYGCCEPLDRKIGILREVPRLRRISISPWCDLAHAVEQIGTDFVFSLKPNPAVLATEQWNPEHAREVLRESLETISGCRVEVILKDLHTIRGEPHRLWEWETIAMEEVERFA